MTTGEWVGKEDLISIVTPAKAGGHLEISGWAPAFAWVTGGGWRGATEPKIPKEYRESGKTENNGGDYQ